ncbi:MAG: hypothetical protein K940chlam9_01611, partial [Chlamydiae bacterium]|nr:hypothetical protein [Chlamydiota bacterium]
PDSLQERNIEVNVINTRPAILKIQNSLRSAFEQGVRIFVHLL